LVPIVQIQASDLVSSQKCLVHNGHAVGFCQFCFSLVCLVCPLKLHTPLSHQLYSVQDANQDEYKQTLQFLIDESSTKFNRLKTSLDKIYQMHHNAENSFNNLVISMEKFFFSILDKILTELKGNIMTNLKENTEIFQNQKEHVQNQLNILEKEVVKSQEAIQEIRRKK
jgi:gas vesicle protein